MNNKTSYVYIITNYLNTTLYTGVCDDLIKRIWQHRNNIGSRFTTKYKITKLIFYEIYNDINEAIIREKQIQGKRKLI